VVRISRLERITNLVLALLDAPRPLSLREIGTEVAGYPAEAVALRQAFERDKRTLRDGGIPVRVERIDSDDQVGYRILPEDYYLPDLALEEAEEEALGFALAAVRVGGGFPETLAARFGAPGAPAPALVVLPELAALPVLHEALRLRARVALGYHGRSRELEGYGLAFVLGRWYFVAHEPAANEGPAVKTYRVDRIEGDPLLGSPQAYEVPVDFDLRAAIGSWMRGAGRADASAVELVVAAREAPDLIAAFGTAAVIGREDDGAYRMRVPTGDEDALVGYLVGFAEAVEVLAPPAVRARLVAELEARAAEQSSAPS
jgi:predicted DNA-binding transcriptional regulator YafY